MFSSDCYYDMRVIRSCQVARFFDSFNTSMLKLSPHLCFAVTLACFHQPHQRSYKLLPDWQSRRGPCCFHRRHIGEQKWCFHLLTFCRIDLLVKLKILLLGRVRVSARNPTFLYYLQLRWNVELNKFKSES